MRSEERDMILQMVAENKISTAEACRTCSTRRRGRAGSRRDLPRLPRVTALEHREFRRLERDLWCRRKRDLERAARDHERAMRGSRPLTGRSLMIHVRDGDETRTHVHIPLGMAMTATKFIPKKARGYFEEYGIDLTDLLDTVSEDLGRVGEIVNIRDGCKSVQVAIVGNDYDQSRPASQPVRPEAPIPPTPPTAPTPPASGKCQPAAPSESVDASPPSV